MTMGAHLETGNGILSLPFSLGSNSSASRRNVRRRRSLPQSMHRTGSIVRARLRRSIP